MNGGGITVAGLTGALSAATKGTRMVEPRKVVIGVASDDWDGQAAAAMAFNGMYDGTPERFWPGLSCDIEMVVGGFDDLEPAFEEAAWSVRLIGRDRHGTEIKTETIYGYGSMYGSEDRPIQRGFDGTAADGAISGLVWDGGQD